MTTKIDLDELERKMRAIIDRAHSTTADGPVTLALIARIRELEAEVARAAGLLEASSDRGARKVWAAGLRESIAKGVVLP